MRILNAEQMREADRVTIHELGIPSMVLMENAGRQVVAAMEATFEDLDGMTVAILSGRGNNGGDGFVIARTLQQRGVDVGVYVVGRIADVRGDAKANLEILGRLGVQLEPPVANRHQVHRHDSAVTGLCRPSESAVPRGTARSGGRPRSPSE